MNDFAEEMKPGTWKKFISETMPDNMQDQVSPDGAPVHTPDMRKSLAWELVLRNIYRTEVSCTYARRHNELLSLSHLTNSVNILG